MSDSTISDLLHLRLERNNERFEEIRATNYGRGISTDLAGEYFELPHQQARLRSQWVSALKSEGKSVDDVVTLMDDSPTPPVPGLRVVNLGSVVRCYMYGTIGVDFTADDLKTVMQENPTSPIDLHVNSEGGNVADGTAIHALIRSHAAPVNVTVDALAASAASFSIMAADSIAMAPGAYMMIHFVTATLSNGTADDFAAAAKRMNEMNDSLKAFYAPRWKGTATQLEAALLQEKYFSAEECVVAGLADSVLDISTPKMAACVGRDFPYQNAPAELSIAARGGPSKFLNTPSRQMTLHRIITSTRSK